MKKLRLNVDALVVESFGTLAAAVDARGTIAGREMEATPACPVTQTDCQTNIIFCRTRIVTQCNCFGAA
ncbi:MAG: hypothetical protein ACJ8J0_00390 [Longimicrobiaceae bacterium]